MTEQYQRLIDDLEFHADQCRSKAKTERERTKKRIGESAFADRCLTLAEAHDAAAQVYEAARDMVKRNVQRETA